MKASTGTSIISETRANQKTGLFKISQSFFLVEETRYLSLFAKEMKTHVADELKIQQNFAF
jgi:hypothetical protein